MLFSFLFLILVTGQIGARLILEDASQLFGTARFGGWKICKDAFQLFVSALVHWSNWIGWSWTRRHSLDISCNVSVRRCFERYTWYRPLTQAETPLQLLHQVQGGGVPAAASPEDYMGQYGDTMTAAITMTAETQSSTEVPDGHGMDKELEDIKTPTTPDPFSPA